MDIAQQERINLKLVKEVEKYPCLYKTDSVEYCRRMITDKAWAEVGRVVGWPGTYLSMFNLFLITVPFGNRVHSTAFVCEPIRHRFLSFSTNGVQNTFDVSLSFYSYCVRIITWDISTYIPAIEFCVTNKMIIVGFYRFFALHVT